MRLVRFDLPGAEKPGVMNAAGDRLDLSAHFADWNREFFRSNGLAKLAEVLAAKESYLPRVSSSLRWAAPVARPGKVVCIGLNYADHARESGADIPKEPIVFLKGTNTVVGPYDEVEIPRNSEKTDWEVELGVILGSDARYLNSEAEAEAAIAGYAVSHDVSERAFQLERGGQWTKGKSCDTFNPLGPWLATRDEIPDPLKLEMRLSVNGIQRQKGTTATMIFNPRFLVHYLSQFMTLEAGDVITTGTPPGVGLGMKPPTYLKVGDVVELSVDGLGAQKQSFIAAR